MKTLRKPTVPKPTDGNLPEALLANEVLHRRPLKRETYQGLMDVKTEKQRKYEERRPLFMMIGLATSLFLTVTVFNWKTYDKTGLLDLGQVENDFEEIIEVPTSLQPPPPPPQKIEVFEIKEVDNEQIIEEVNLDLDVEVTENMKVEDIIYVPDGEPEEEKAEEIFQIVEDQPTFPGGIDKFYKFVGENIDYPDVAKRLGISGRVFVRFVIEKDGNITDINVVKGIGAGCDEEAVRVLKDSPKWNPGKQRGHAVRVYMTVPIMFMLKER